MPFCSRARCRWTPHTRVLEFRTTQVEGYLRMSKTSENCERKLAFFVFFWPYGLDVEAWSQCIEMICYSDEFRCRLAIAFDLLKIEKRGRKENLKEFELKKKDDIIYYIV